MNALQYARKNVFFWQSSPIAGQFDEKRYPLIIKPLTSLDNIHCKASVIYGPTQSIKTVFLQIATAYRLDIKRKSLLAVSQTDDDAREFATIKLKPFLERIPSLIDTTKKGTYSRTLSHWLWSDHELIISGPGENAQQSKSVCYVHTDEAHRWNIDYPGALPALDDRMGLRWDRHALHATTAADAGAEIDLLYHRGQQNEWHVRCVHCNELFQPLWIEASRETYNGHEVFTFKESQSETETLESIVMHCPHCDGLIVDHPRTRAEMDDGADYRPNNPGADKQFDSYRWNAFAPRWKAWRDLLSIYLRAIHSAKLGNLDPYQNWIKKQEVRTWNGEFPLLGDSVRGRDYCLGDVKVITENRLRTASFDVQEEGGFHLWAQCDEFQRSGSSRRVRFVRLESWNQCRQFQLDHNVNDKDTGCDFGHRDREVFGRCSEWKWFALKSGDFEDFPHRIMDIKSHQVSSVMLPYSEPRLENPMSGKAHSKVVVLRRGVPNGLCLSRLWSKPTLYAILYTHKNGNGHYYGIATDIGEEFTAQLHSYVPALDIDKKTGSTRKTIWRQVRKMDHAFITSAQSLLLAMIAGYFPLDSIDVNKNVA